MPELPEVETVVRGLRGPLRAATVESTWLRHKALYRRGSLSLRRLVGRTVSRVERVGKNAVIRFKPKAILLVNLGMTGHLMVCEEDARPAERSTAHLHSRMRLGGGRELRYYDARRFGHFYVAEVWDFERDLNIGPDPFKIEAEDLARRLRGRSAAVKTLLLDQRIVSGIGNIYADEALFGAGVDPRASGDRAARKAALLLDNTRDILTQAIDHGGSTLRDYRRHDGSPGEYQQRHAVYGRAGEACKACGAKVRKIVLSGRGTHFCPKCQR